MAHDPPERSLHAEHTTAAEEDDGESVDRITQETDRLALLLAWSHDEAWRMGEALLLPGKDDATVWLGRGESTPGRPVKGTFGQQRPGSWTPGAPLRTPTLSRYQLHVRRVDGAYLVSNEGRSPLLCNGVEVAECEIAAGDLLQLGRQLLLLCARRPAQLAGDDAAYPSFPFGHADPHGLVGESPAMWRLRRRVAFVAARAEHVIVVGPSGTGKELVATTIHALSSRSARPMVARNAATLPEALIDAELFGNAKNYPNAGMAERPGLVGEAHGSTLFLDELAELPISAQAHLLRVLDHGEYQRLGEARSRTSDFRLIGATNRDLSLLKPDLLARLAFRVPVAELEHRKEDLPLLVRHLLRRMATKGDPAALALFANRDARAEPRIPIAWMAQLLRRRYPTNVRELEALLWEALAAPEAAFAKVDSGLPSEASKHPAPEPKEGGGGGAPRREADARAAPEPQTEVERVQRMLDANRGSIARTWRALGFSSRFALMRFIKKHALEVRRRPARGHS